MIARVMAECDRLKASSVAFPVLGTGALGFPRDVAAKIIVQGTHQYLQQCSITSVKVTFAVFQDVVFDAFQRELTTLTSAPAVSSGPIGAQPLPHVSPTHSSVSIPAVSQKHAAQLPIVVMKGLLTDAQVSFG